MLSNDKYRAYTEILESELIIATGCTEPIAVALAGAKLREYLVEFPTKVDVYCSGNIIKNVKGVVVPNSGGLRGIDTAVMLGIIAGDPNANLQVIQRADDDDRRRLQRELAAKYVDVHLATGVPNLYILVKGESENHTAEVEIVNKHNNINRVVVDGRELFNLNTASQESEVGPDKNLLNGRDIIEYAETVDLELVRPFISEQIKDNMAIAEEGLRGDYGASMGKTLLERGNDVYTRAKALAAAGSDARMNGCPMPVVINCGSGNQGMTVSLPIIEFAKDMNCPETKLYRALVLANLMAVHQKKYIGYLSAYCGVASAASAAAAGICWLKGGDYSQIMDTVTTAIATIGGMVCDGAKSSCATKIAAAVDTALNSMDLAFAGRHLSAGEGLTMDSQEETIKAIGRMAREGMKQTDIEILNIMLGK
ncbi:MAG: serine dehydratase subunit alpha family protein [Erysipelotrichaceae bacterium]|nr:serine dehydratase subunit alpha family protein [Erysipelotrichaceae bacterium]